MKLFFPFLGKTRSRWIDQGIDEYAQRLRHYLPVEVRVIRERYRANATEADRRRQASNLLLDQCCKDDLVVHLDPGGRQFTSPNLAEQLRDWQDSGVRRVCFLIGGHLGLDRELVTPRAHLEWSLSRLTLTHEMSRVLVLEQLYRACTINSGSRYHK